MGLCDLRPAPHLHSKVYIVLTSSDFRLLLSIEWIRFYFGSVNRLKVLDCPVSE